MSVVVDRSSPAKRSLPSSAFGSIYAASVADLAHDSQDLFVDLDRAAGHAEVCVREAQVVQPLSFAASAAVSE